MKISTYQAGFLLWALVSLPVSLSVNLFIAQEGVPRLVSSQTNNLEEPCYLKQEDPFDPNLFDYDADDNNCPQNSGDLVPYFWKPIESEWNTYLQFDFATRHTIQRINQYRYTGQASEDANNLVTTFRCQFSEDGLTFMSYEQCGCQWNGNQVARFIRIFPPDDWTGSSDAQKISCFFIVFGTVIANPETYSYPHVNAITAGFQARLSLNVINPNFACDDNLEVDVRKGSDVIMENGVPKKMEGVIHYRVEYLDEYKRCLVLFMIEAFQFIQKDTYNLQIPSYSISQEMKLPFDPRESYFHVNIFEGHFFVTMVDFPHGLDQEDPERLLKVKDACSSQKGGADVLSEYFATQFQAVDTNFFLQSMIYGKWGKKIGDDVSDKVYVYLRDSVKEMCTYIDKETGLMDVLECRDYNDNIAGIFCYFYDAEINKITVEPESCAVKDASGDKVAIVKYRVQPVIIGARESREVVCQAWDNRDLVIRNKDRTFEMKKDEVAIYEVEVDTNDVLAKIECVAGRRKNDTVFVAIKGTFELQRSHDELKFISADQTPVYLEPTDYDTLYKIKVQSVGYLMDFFTYAFQPPNGGWTAESTAVSTEYFYTCTGNHLKVRATGTLEFLGLSPKSAGLYRFSMEAGGELKQVESEFIHPFKIECSERCNTDILHGKDVEVTCDINHHLFTDSALFESESVLNISLKFWKAEYFMDIPGYNKLNPCEYTNTVERSLLYDKRALRSLSFDEQNRKATVTFGILSTQPWNIGWYYLAVTPISVDHCYYFGRSFDGNCDIDVINNPIVPATCESFDKETTTHQYLMFYVNNVFDVGIVTPRPQKDINPRGLYIAYDAFMDNGFLYFYRLLPPFGNKEPRDVCARDGGTFVRDTEDAVTSRILRNLESERVELGNINLIKFWTALTCNFGMNPDSPDIEADPSEVFFSMERASDRRLLTLAKFDQEVGFSQVENADVEIARLCRYQRGKVWDIFADPGKCLYKPLDVNIGLKQTVGALIHGSPLFTLQCEALPRGSYENKTFESLTGSERVTYEVPFPEESDVKQFRCRQIANESITTESNWFQLGFESTFLDMKVDDFIEPLDYWCRPTDSSLTQPCFGEDVSLKSCVVGNPFKNCTWGRLYPADETPLVNGERGVTWEVIPDEYPQCNSTRRCYYLRFQNLNPFLHSGLYFLKCYSGIEGSHAETQLRTHTRYFDLEAHPSAPIGDNPFTYNVTCSPGKLEGQVVIYGQEVNVKVTCSGSRNGDIDAIVTEHSAGTFVINFIIPWPETTTECQVDAYNDVTDLTSLLISDRLDNNKIWESVYIEETSRSDSQVSFCCRSCGVNIGSNHLRFLCMLSQDNSVVVGFRDTELKYDTETYIAERCATVKLPIGMFVCTCALFRENVATTTFYRDGTTRSTFATASSIQVEGQPELVNDTTSNPNEKKETTTETPTTSTLAVNEVTVKMTRNELELLRELAALEEIVLFKSQIHFKVLSNSIDRMVNLLEPNIERIKAQQYLSILGMLQTITLTTNLTNPTLDQLSEMANRIVDKGIKFLEGVTANSPALVKNESAMISVLAMIENYTHWVMSHSGDGVQVSLTTESSRVVAFRLTQDLSWATKESFNCSRVDHNGITKNTLQGGHLFTHDVLASAQSGNTIAMFLFDWSICEANQRLRAWPQSTPLSKDRYRINNKFFKRTTDLFIASMRDSHGKHLPAGANYSMNKKENIPQKSMTGQYTTSSTFKCVYWDVQSGRFVSENNTAETLSEPSRSACKFVHTTTFAVVADIDQVKEDPVEVVSYHDVSYVGFVIATIVTSTCFSIILFYLEEMDSVSAVAHMIYFACLNTYLFGYLSGGGEVDSPMRCHLSQIFTIFGIGVSMGSVNNILLGQILDLQIKSVEPRQVYFVYFFNLLGLPSIHVLLMMLIFRSSVGDFYSCFPDFLSIQSVVVLSPPIGIQLVNCAMITFRIRKESDTLAEMLEEELTAVAITTSARNAQLMLIANAATFVFNAYALSQENFYLHLGSAAATAFLSFFAAYFLMFSSSEIQDAYFDSKQLKIPEPRKKKRRRSSVPNPNHLIFDEIVVPSSDRTISTDSQLSSLSEFLESKTTRPKNSSRGSSPTNSISTATSADFAEPEKSEGGSLNDQKLPSTPKRNKQKKKTP